MLRRIAGKPVADFCFCHIIFPNYNARMWQSQDYFFQFPVRGHKRRPLRHKRQRGDGETEIMRGREKIPLDAVREL